MKKSIKQAKGGKVWSAKSGSRKVKLIGILEVVLSPVLFVMIAVLVIVVVTVCQWLISSNQEQDEKVRFEIAYEQEYGYSDVKLMEENKATVTVTQTGETKEVNTIDYKGAPILYETDEQLKAKMLESDAGTYEVMYAVQRGNEALGEGRTDG